MTKTIALVLTQRRDSGNWDPAGYAAASAMATRYGLSLNVVEDTGFAEAPNAFRRLAGEGVDCIIGHGSDYAGPVVEVAREYPQTRFVAFSYITDTAGLPNIAGYCVSWNQVEFLIGAICALASKRGHVATIRGVELVPAEYAMGNLIRGARHVKPDIRFDVEHIRDWYDMQGARAAALNAIQAGADVLYAAADTADVAVQSVADDMGVLTFGEYTDEGHKFPNAIITSFLVNEGKAYDEVGRMMAEGPWTPGIRKLDAASGDLMFTPFRNVDPGVQSAFQNVFEKVASGEIQVEG